MMVRSGTATTNVIFWLKKPDILYRLNESVMFVKRNLFHLTGRKNTVLLHVELRQERSEKMQIVKPSFKIIDRPTREQACKQIERIGRVCYKSEDKITNNSCYDFVRMLKKKGHLAMLEHVSATVKWIIDRGTSHALVRHRIGAFAQESTIYCDYTRGKFGGEIAVIMPDEITTAEQTATWIEAMSVAEFAYKQLREQGLPAKIARAVLPTCTKTELVTTFNLRQWMHVFEVRQDPADHPLTRKVTGEIYKNFIEWLPEIFEDDLSIRR